jgi:indole-3-glycerol phosphate synthase
MTNTLEEICTKKRTHIMRKKARISLAQLELRIAEQAPPRGFKAAIEKKMQSGQFALIAEIKKASPSKGIIRSDFNPSVLAKAYAAGGATCLSVLTDEPYFEGRDEFLQQARDAVSLPVLRKDFMLDPYQVYESWAMGADCILLIMAALKDEEAKELETLSAKLGMDVLVEAHDEEELARALRINPGNPSKMIGINNRNLKTLKVDLATSETLAKQLPANILRVCESGIGTHADLVRMQQSGFNCFLVGESLMRKDDVATATKELLRI